MDIELRCSTPPYRESVPLTLPCDPKPGGLVFAPVGPEAEGLDDTAMATLRAVRGRALWAPLVLIVEPRFPTPALHRLQTMTGARMCLPSAEPDVATLRAGLVDPGNWTFDLPAWARARWPNLPARTRAALEATLLGKPMPLIHHRDGPRRPKPRTVRDWFAAAGIPSPRWWEAVLKLIGTYLTWWSDPGLDAVDAVPLAPLVYANAHSFSNQSESLAGARPPEWEALLTWEWALWSTLEVWHATSHR